MVKTWWRTRWRRIMEEDHRRQLVLLHISFQRKDFVDLMRMTHYIFQAHCLNVCFYQYSCHHLIFKYEICRDSCKEYLVSWLLSNFCQVIEVWIPPSPNHLECLSAFRCLKKHFHSADLWTQDSRNSDSFLNIWRHFLSASKVATTFRYDTT